MHNHIFPLLLGALNFVCGISQSKRELASAGRFACVRMISNRRPTGRCVHVARRKRLLCGFSYARASDGVFLAHPWSETGVCLEQGLGLMTRAHPDGLLRPQ